jgi:hypothetical protein
MISVETAVAGAETIYGHEVFVGKQNQVRFYFHIQ